MNHWTALATKPSRHDHSRVLAGLTLTVHALLIAGIATHNAPNANEPAHLAAGLYHWQTGRFDAYCVNPPLIRLYCAIPLAWAADAPRLRPRLLDDGSRLEWHLDDQLLSSLGFERFRRYLIMGRLMILPLALAGGVYCWRWATHDVSPSAGWAAWWMWVFSPSLLTWSSTIGPDAGAAALGIGACYHFRRWIESVDRSQALMATITTALAIAAKSTWVLLPPLLLLVWLVAAEGGNRTAAKRQLTAMAVGVVMLVNMVYGFESTGKRLGDFQFTSHSLTGRGTAAEDNRFRGTWLGKLPVPLPANFLAGIDIQRREFEQRKWSYLAGRWRWGSWPHYYLCAALWKIPDGFLCLMVIRAMQQLTPVRHRMRRPAFAWPLRWNAAQAARMVVPLGMALAVSSQTGFGHHFRYALPCLPFAFLYASGAVGSSASRPSRTLAWVALSCGAVQSLAAWPQCHSYFSRLSCALFDTPPLLDSNLDWGEDLLLAARWLQTHPHARPAFHAVVTDDLAAYVPAAWRRAAERLEPGWYIVSLQRTLDPRDRFSFLRHRPPRARIGASLRVYHLTWHDLERHDGHTDRRHGRNLSADRDRLP